MKILSAFRRLSWHYKWKDLDTLNAKKAELIPYHVVYKTLLAAIESPKSAREALEIQLNQLLNQ